MPNAPWATTTAGPNPSDLYADPGKGYAGTSNAVSMTTPGMEPIYETYVDEEGLSHSVIVGYQNSDAAAQQNVNDLREIYKLQGGSAGGTAIENRQMLDQLRSVLLGDPTIAQQTLTQMGWTGTVDDFKALSPAQQNVWAHEHAAATKGVVNQYGWNSTYGGFYKDPNTGVIDFTKWWDGSASGYDANMNPTSAATMHPGVAASYKVKAETEASMNAAMQKALASNPQIAQKVGQVGQPVPATTAQAPTAIKPPVIGVPNPPGPPIQPPNVTAPGFPDNGEVKIMPAPGRPMPPYQPGIGATQPYQPTPSGAPPADVRIRNASRIR